MESGEKTLLGPLNGTFTFKKHADGAVDKSVVLCSFCHKEFSYHRSTSSLKYHLNAKHAKYVAVSPGVRASTAPDAGASSQPQQATLDPAFSCRLSKSTCDWVTDCLAAWTALDCRAQQVSRGFIDTVGSPDKTYKPPSRSTTVSKV